MERIKQMPDNVKSKVIAFVSGDIFTMGWFTLLQIPDETMGMIWKVVVTLIVGAVGGAAGMLGKDLYTAAKKYLKRKK